MMHSFELSAIVYPFVAIFIATFGISFKYTGWIIASVCAALIKANLFFIYFGFVFDGTYTFLDDWSYLEGGRDFLKHDVGFFDLVGNWDLASQIGRGDHFIYYLYNSYAIKVFGDEYFSPVAFNIILTIFIAYLGSGLIGLNFDLSKKQSKIFYFFLLLHPDILAWSNVVNGKDILVLFLHVLLLIALSLLFHRRILAGIFLATLVVAVLLFLRFYVPILFAISLLITSFLISRDDRIKYMVCSFAFIGLASLWTGGGGVQYAMDSIWENLVNPIFGFVKIALTPIPFGADEDYSFLDYSALLHWALMPFAVIGFLIMCRQKSKFSTLLVTYFLVFLTLYAFYGELQGPRHRVQLDLALATFQFFGLWRFVRLCIYQLGFWSLRRSRPRELINCD